jgi:lysophospholipase L1-like esterase
MPAAIGMGIGIPFKTGVGGGVVVPPVEDLVLFDSSAGGNFSTAFDYPVDATLTVSSGSIAFANTGAAKQLRVALKGQSGSVLNHALDRYRVDATLTVNAYPAADDIGAQIGMAVPAVSWFFGHEQKAHPASATLAYARSILTTYAPRVSDGSGYAIGAGLSVVVRAEYSQGTLLSRVNYAGSGERNLDKAMTLTATTDELPRMFSDGGGVTFRRGTITLTAMKIYAPMSKNVPYFLLGDSITQGRFASTYANGWGMVLRASNADKVVICGAPSATAGDWQTRMDIVLQATPRRVFVMLGVNDAGGGASLATYQTRMNSILSQLDAASIPVVLVSTTPTGNALLPTYNSWLAGLGRPYIDVFTPLATGNALAATYNSGDGVHPNTAGHALIASTVQAAITANGW